MINKPHHALVRAEVELARAEITRDVKKGLTGSVFFIAALVVGISETAPRVVARRGVSALAD